LQIEHEKRLQIKMSEFVLLTGSGLGGSGLGVTIKQIPEKLGNFQIQIQIQPIFLKQMIYEIITILFLPSSA
jgi:hypothetical protein